MEKFVLENRTAVGIFFSHRYKNEKGEISMIYPCIVTENKYEIYCIEGDFFESIERFDTIEEAEGRIYELLSIGS
jgi:hypothetical protein